MTEDTTAGLVLVANAVEGSISVFRCADGALTRLSVAEGLTRCATFVVDARRDLVHAAVRGEPAGVVTLHLNRRTGTLTPRGRLDLPGDSPLAYVSLAREGTVLLGASYHGDHAWTAPVGEDGVGAPVSVVDHARSHAILPSPDGRHAYIASLGDDVIAQYAIGEDLRLTPLGPGPVAAPTGSGPRHLLLDADGTAVHVLTEFSGELLSYRRDPRSGLLTGPDTVAVVDPEGSMPRGALGEDPRENDAIWSADLHWGAGQRTLWASDRTRSTLTCVGVREDGTLTPPLTSAPTLPQPRGFDLNADGSRMVVAGEASTEVALYAVEGGELRLLDRAETGEGPNWVRFVEDPDA